MPLSPETLEALLPAVRTLEVAVWQLSRLLPRDEPVAPAPPILPN